MKGKPLSRRFFLSFLKLKLGIAADRDPAGFTRSDRISAG
jgi:hypothetical protein